MAEKRELGLQTRTEAMMLAEDRSCRSSFQRKRIHKITVKIGVQREENMFGLWLHIALSVEKFFMSVMDSLSKETGL
jgi:hypothetical protein